MTVPAPEAFSVLVANSPTATVPFGTADVVPVIQNAKLRKLSVNGFLDGRVLSVTYDGAGVYPTSQTNGWAISTNLRNDGNEVGIWNIKDNDTEGVGLYQKTGPSSAILMGNIYVDGSSVELDISAPNGRIFQIRTPSAENMQVGSFDAVDVELTRGNVAVAMLTAAGLDLPAGKNQTMRPGTAPGNPTTGWVLYVDSGDGNKLKAKASTGTTVTLGTP